MEAFSKRYMACNPKLYGSSDQVYVLAFSIIMLHTDAFNKHNRAKMSRADYVKNTRMDGIPNEVLEYIYDNVTYTQFIFVDEERDITGNKIDNLDTTGSFFHLGASTSSNTPGTGSLREKARADPYTLIARGLTHELRPDIEALIPSRNPFSFTGTVPYFDSSRLRRAFGGAVTIQIVNGPTAKPSSALARLTPELPNEPMVDEHVFTNLRAVKVGLAYRKDEGDGLMKNVTRKWREWCVVLTGSQLLFMKDTTLAEELQLSFLAASRRNTESSDDQLVVRITGLKPDSVFSLEDGIALMDVTYTRRPNTFRLILAKDEQQYLMEVPDEIEMNAWITHINYAATFKSVGVPFRSLQSNDSNSFSRSTSSLAGIIPTTIERQARVSTSSSVAGRSGYEEDMTNDRVSGTRRGSVSNKPWPINRHSSLRDGPKTRSQNLYNEDPQMVANGSTPNSKIEELEQEILKAKADLNEDLRIARNLAVLTPFQVSTRTRLQQAIVPISHRIRVARHHLSRLVCYREILLRDNILDKTGAPRAVVGEQTETVALTDRSDPVKTTSFLDPFPAKADREPIGQLPLVQGPLSGPPTSLSPSRSSFDQTRKGSASKLAEVRKQITQIPNPTRDYRSYSSPHTSRLALPTDGPPRSVPFALSQLIPEAEFPPSTPTVPVPTPTPLKIGPSSPSGASPVHTSTHIAPSSIFIPRSPVESTSRSRRRPSTANTMGSATTHNANGSVLSATSPPKRFTQAWGLP
ncbi:hypothetical protein CROQUDRAFT_325680 [Cronartium quercuum f. sp. fusiforme G11]|uniref:Uncharacterized protein n=1 Tax=Cronartium quercuum f. sp. fusiforme G11 TaxID=708437 RepID=A0A9P6N768_9BASI|nr:hypothetical protein CROQUDRAFT_325680 [Cronartium quercuum f. sp. fusiforme G11]